MSRARRLLAPAREVAILHVLDAPRPASFDFIVQAARIADPGCVAADVANDLLEMARRGIVRTTADGWRIADEIGLPRPLPLEQRRMA